MARTVILYSLALAALAWLLQWIQYRHQVRLLSTEIYVLLVALGFTALGLWAGRRLTNRQPAEPFQPNRQALDYLGISPRELDVLGLLDEGLSNRAMAARLYVSENTVKTHLKHLYDKLEVSSRTQAVRKARELRFIP